MTSIEVTRLQKIFQTKRKAAGLGASVRALFKPQYSEVEAVRKISFAMEAGELLGFIGPNGAGKSTTIKMLTGILHPSAVLTFSLYPSVLFNTTTKFVLLTIVPAALIGTVPAEFVRSFTWQSLLQISAGALIFPGLAVTIFRSGLRRYESGSAIQVEV